MKKYIFRNGIKIENDYKYIFLCGAHYSVPKDKKRIDKRIILKDFLQKYDDNNIPIILEENFIFQRNKKKLLCYDDIFMKNLYQVELLTSFLVDNVIIIQETISTGAEAGLFLSSKDLWEKTCLLVPDEIAVEEDKVGAFLNHAFLRDNELKKIIFYPMVEQNIVSDNLRYWHTYFYKDQIGKYLGEQLLEFLINSKQNSEIKFAKTDKLKEGYIKYQVVNNEVIITANVKSLMLCISAIFAIKEFQKEFFSGVPLELKEYIAILNKWLKSIYINTIEEFTGESISSCKIIPNLDIKKVYISGVIGMILYLYQASGFIEIKKTESYETDKKVSITRKMSVIKSDNEEDNEAKRFYFYKKYSDCIIEQVGIQIK